MSKQVEFFVLTFTSKDKDDKNIYLSLIHI